MAQITLGHKDALEALVGKTIAKVRYQERKGGGNLETTDGMRVTFGMDNENSDPRIGIYAFITTNAEVSDGGGPQTSDFAN